MTDERSQAHWTGSDAIGALVNQARTGRLVGAWGDHDRDN